MKFQIALSAIAVCLSQGLTAQKNWNDTSKLVIPKFSCDSEVVPVQKSWKDTSKLVIPEFKYKFNASGSHYIKATAVAQMWARYSDMNPGSKIYDTPVTNYSDIGIRRLRFSVWTQLTDRIFFYTQFGQNNFNFLSKRNTGAFFHDAIVEYKVAPQLSLGTGLTGWSGMSRYASPAVGSILSVDAPLYQQVTNGVTDQFLRKLSIYAKGQIGKLDYRVAITSPMAAQNSYVTLPAISTDANFSMAAPKLQSQAYLFWQFFDKENNTLPYTTGTYLGKKKILNLGAGFIHQKDAMWYLNSAGDTTSTDMLLLGADVFLDMPVNKKGSAVTAYVAFNDFDLGPNYVRNSGVMNPATGTGTGATYNGAGVAFPMIGTGQTVFTQVGYKFKDGLLGENGTLQPYASVQYSQLKKLSDPMIMFEGGVNWLIHGTHTGKLSLNYQSRPVFEANSAGEYVQKNRKGMMVLQYQIAL
jgi:hypothetical protein